jgi:hypothetical protein
MFGAETHFHLTPPGSSSLLQVSINSGEVQVKGSANNDSDSPWWVGYGFCSEAIIAKQNNETMFNRRSSFYRASHVILVAVRSPKVYSCVVLPVGVAEEAAQLNLDRDYRTPTREGKPKKPNKVWVELEPRPKARTRSLSK